MGLGEDRMLIQPNGLTHFRKLKDLFQNKVTAQWRGWRSRVLNSCLESPAYWLCEAAQVTSALCLKEEFGLDDIQALIGYSLMLPNPLVGSSLCFIFILQREIALCIASFHSSHWPFRDQKSAVQGNHWAAPPLSQTDGRAKKMKFFW